MVPPSSKRTKRPPVTLAHMHALVLHLSPFDPLDAAVLAATACAFWGVCRCESHRDCYLFMPNVSTSRLGELLPPSENLYDPDIHVSNDTPIRFATTPAGVDHAHFHVPKTKTCCDGEDIHLTALTDISSPIPFLTNHLDINASVTRGAPLFAYRSDRGWTTLTKAKLLARCTEVWSPLSLACITGHAFRIGGATELLLRGVPPDVVMVQGRWKSKAFLEYWRKLDEVLTGFISNTFNPSCIVLIRQSVDTFHCLNK